MADSGRLRGWKWDGVNTELEAWNNGTRIMTFTSAGNMGLGTTSPSLAVGTGLDIDITGTASIRLADSTNSQAFEINMVGASSYVDFVTLNASADIIFSPTGGIVVGTKSQLTISDGDGSTNMIPVFQLHGAGQADGSAMLATFSTTATRAAAATLALVKGGAATVTVGTAVTDNEVLGSITAYGDDGTDIESAAGSIEFVVQGTPGTGDMPGSIEFYTTADGGEALGLCTTMNADKSVALANGAPKLTLGTESTFGTTQPTNTLVLREGTAPVGAITTAGGLFSTSTVINKIIADGTANSVQT